LHFRYALNNGHGADIAARPLSAISGSRNRRLSRGLRDVVDECAHELEKYADFCRDVAAAWEYGVDRLAPARPTGQDCLKGTAGDVAVRGKSA